MKNITRQQKGLACRQAGFTLVELALYGGLLSILLVVFMQILGSVLDAQLESESATSLEQASRFINARFIYDFLTSDSVASPSAFGQTGTVLVLTKAGQNYQYNVSGNNLVLTNGGSQNALNNYDTTVSNVSFTKIGNAGGKPTVRISFTLTGKTKRNGATESKIVQTTYGLR